MPFIRRGLIPGGSATAAALAAVLLGAIDLTVISTLLPGIILDLRLNTADIDRYIWIVNAYLLAYIVAIPVAGRMSDLAGRRTAFHCALALFLIGSLIAALADNLTSLIAARAIQGAGGGALLPITMALTGDRLPPGRRVTALGLVGAVDTLGWVLGPVWGAIFAGGITDAADAWRWVFWTNLPLGIAIGVFIHRQIPAGSGSISSRDWHRLDGIGALLLGGALILLNIGLSSGGETGVARGSAFRALGGTHNPLADHLPLLLATGSVLTIVFIWWQGRTDSPLLPVSHFANPAFRAALVANFLIGASLIAVMVDVPLTVALLADADRIGAVSALLLAPFTLMMAGASLVGGFVTSRIGERSTTLLGLMFVVAGLFALRYGLRTGDETRMLPGLLVCGAGFGLVIAPISSIAIEHAPDLERGAAAASTILFRLLGMTTSISALTAFGIHRLQSLSSGVEPIIRGTDETTAEFFARQNQFIQEIAIPMAVHVIRDSFLIAAVVAMLAAVPVHFLSRPVAPVEAHD